MSKGKYALCKIIVLLVAVACMLAGCNVTKGIGSILFGYEKPKPFSYVYIEYATACSKEYAIQGATGSEENVQIPAEHNGYPVTYILENALSSRRSIRSLSMDSIIYIQAGAFKNCTNLRNLELGSVQEIGHDAFLYCISLTSVTIPASCKEIGSNAFWDCLELDTVYFMGAPEMIGRDVFDKDVTIYGPQNSSVEEYARENELAFVAWDGTSQQDN